MLHCGSLCACPWFNGLPDAPAKYSQSKNRCSCRYLNHSLESTIFASAPWLPHRLVVARQMRCNLLRKKRDCFQFIAHLDAVVSLGVIGGRSQVTAGLKLSPLARYRK